VRRALALALASVALCAALAAIPAHAAPPDPPVLQVTATASPSPSPPGTTGQLVLAIKNAGDVTAVTLQADVLVVDGGLRVHPDTTVTLGSLSPGESTTASPFTFDVPANATAGFAHVTVEITFGYDNGGSNAYGSATATAAITIRTPVPLAVVAFSPDRLQPGEQAVANLTVANLARSNLTDVDIAWSSAGNAILPVNHTDHVVLPSLMAGADATVSFPIAASAAAPRGLQFVTLPVRFTDPTGTRLNATFTVGIIVGGATEFQASVQRTAGPAVTLQLANVGVNGATAVVVTPLAGGAPVDDGPVFLGALDAGQSKPFTLHLKATAASATLRLGLAYTDSAGAPATAELRVPILEGTASPDVAANVQEVDGATVTVAVTNTGLQPVTAVQVQLVPGPGYRIEGPDTHALGTLRPGEYLTADFTVHRLGGGGAPGARIAYTDAQGSRQEAAVPLDLAGATAAPPWPAWEVAAVTVVALLVLEGAIAGAAVTARRRRARRQAAEDEEERREEAEDAARHPPPPPER